MESYPYSTLHNGSEQRGHQPESLRLERPLSPVSSIGELTDNVTRQSQQPKGIQNEPTYTYTYTYTDEPIVKSEKPSPSIVTKWKQLDKSGSWLFEIEATVLCIIGFGLLVGFLAYVDGRLYEDWQYTASPNTVISIVAGISKAAMLVPVSSCLSQLKWNRYRSPNPLYQMQVLDSASRGPWGSMEVIWRFTPGLATAGALLTILAIAVDPFAQQILAFPSRVVQASNETAYVQKTQEWADRSVSNYGGIPASMQVAILTGLSQDQHPLEPKCTSNNCKYPDFTTMGICSTCEDVGEKVNQACSQVDSSIYRPLLLDHQNAPVSCDYHIDGFKFHIDVTNTTMPGSDGTNQNLVLPFSYWITYTMDTSSLSLNKGSFPWIEKPLVNFFAADYTREVIYTSNNATKPPPKPSVTECALYLCERQYTHNSYSNNNRNLQTTNTHQLSISNDLPTSDRLLKAFPIGGSGLSDNSSYHLNQDNYINLKDVLAMVLGTDSSTSSGLQTSTILRNRNLTQAFESMATSMTDNMRTGGQAIAVPGTAYRTETFIQVRWPWIILPIVLVIGSIALFIATATTSRGPNTVLWKSAILPLLVGRLDTLPGHVGIKSLRNSDEIQRVSKTMNVAMDQDEHALVFVER